VLLYCTEACPLIKSHIASFQFVVHSCFGKIFNTRSKDVINEGRAAGRSPCHGYRKARGAGVHSGVRGVWPLPSPASAMLSFEPALRYLTPTGRVPQLTNPSCWTRGRFQAAESQPRLDYRKLPKKAATNYDSRSEVTRQWLLTELLLLIYWRPKSI